MTLSAYSDRPRAARGPLLASAMRWTCVETLVLPASLLCSSLLASAGAQQSHIHPQLPILVSAVVEQCGVSYTPWAWIYFFVELTCG